MHAPVAFFTRALVAALLATAACGSSPSPESRCDQVREHLIDLQLPKSDSARERHADVMRRAMGEEFIANCAQTISATQARCVLDASSAKQAMACSSSRLAGSSRRSE